MMRLRELYTLRNQIFIGFFVVMLIIISVAGVFIYDRVSTLLKNNTEKHIQQTAVQATGRLDAIISQIDSMTLQVATNTNVQQLLMKELDGQPGTFNERQSLLEIAGSYQAYTNNVESLELYTSDNKLLFPMGDSTLTSRVDKCYIEEANRQKGRLVWIGIDTNDPNYILAIRQISMLDRWFMRGGYILVRIQRSSFELNESTVNNEAGESILLVDEHGRLVNSIERSDTVLEPFLDSENQTVTFEGQDYVMVKQHSDKTNWTLIILTPVQYITKGISVLRTALYASGGIGALLFLIMSFSLSTLITRPIIQLIKAMRKSRFGVLTPNLETVHTIELSELNNTYNQMVNHMNQLIRVVYEKEMLQSRTELKALQAQINPHFLFNTLEAFNWSLEEKGEEELASLVVAMSKLFRYTISSPNQDEWVTIGVELEQVKRYLQLMQMRLGERLSWSIDISPSCNSVAIPKLLIQPLVENAILHGVESKIKPGKIIVSVLPSDREGWTTVTVSDDGPGMNEELLRQLSKALEAGSSISSKGSGIGLVNVQQRLKLYYGSEIEKVEGLRLSSRISAGTIVEFEIPNELGGHDSDKINSDC
ncbi:cache domain-containing sensor histidine kinase [Paenibacillus crassostreae]|uniref:histidine kinase n=1 Tax=Paenibacillus crassostreae TaxID=1763538 RepID=A0A167APL7_9BACL|nr:sensor histidine kinase [Paenibacillus crassostreae]OAB71284.1 histidine kinase [Paenibacillus crassostreae]